MGNVIVKCKSFLTSIFSVFATTKIMKFIHDFSKTLKNQLHIVGNVIVKFEKFPTLIFCFCAHKKMKLIRGGHFEFQLNLKKSPAHLHIVGNVIVNFNNFSLRF